MADWEKNSCRLCFQYLHRRLRGAHANAPAHPGPEGGSLSSNDASHLHFSKVRPFVGQIHDTVLTRDSTAPPGTAGTEIAPIDLDELE